MLRSNHPQNVPDLVMSELLLACEGGSGAVLGVAHPVGGGGRLGVADGVGEDQGAKRDESHGNDHSYHMDESEA